MIAAVLAGFILAPVFAFSKKILVEKTAKLFALLPLILFVYFVSFSGQVASGEVVDFTYSWVPSLGIDLDFRIDGLSTLFLLLITGVGTLVFFYTSNYLKGHEKLSRFYAYLSLFMASMIGLVLSDNVFLLFIFWELTSISSFFLIGFNNTQEGSRKSAITALAITGFGGLFLLSFAIFSGGLTGTSRISEMAEMTELFSSGTSSVLLLIFLLVAAFTKSAQFPFHFWLPGAMKAPTPVSTYLHSATMVKAGVFLLLRFSPHFSLNEWWSPVLILFGAITMVYAAIHTLFRTDMKGVLAYSTISALGILVFLIGLGNSYALSAALVFIVVHALYKAALFLVTGIVDHKTGTRDLTVLSGLRSFMWPVAIAGFISAASSAGIPLFIGFIGKDLIYEGTLHSAMIWTTVVAVLTNFLLGYAGFAVGIKPFTGPKPEKSVAKPSPVLWFPPVLLAAGSLVFGLFPGLLEGIIIPAYEVTGGQDFHPLKIWHGFNLVLLLSGCTILLAILLYRFWKLNPEKETFISRFDPIAPKTILLKASLLFEKMAAFWTRTAQNGHLRNYVLIIIVALITALIYHLIGSPLTYLDQLIWTPLEWGEVVVVSIMFVAIIFTVFSKSRLAAVAGLGVVGYAMCFIFVFFSAPDLAMTQFTIDTLTVILFVLVLYRLPPYLKLTNNRLRIRDGIVSLAFGALITLLALEVMNESPARLISEFYAESSYLKAKGKNVVNVILVDFRGIDTLIEITVLSIAAIGVFGLLKLRLKKSEK